MSLDHSDAYKLIRQIGTGVTGAVWIADGPSGRVAMRRFTSAAPPGSEEWKADRAHFLQAARQCLAFRHPRVVPVLDVIDDQDDAWIASEFVEDETLESILKHERFSTAQTNKILRSIAQILDQAHRAGIVHADLKPSNIFVDAKKSVRLAGFAVSPRARRSPGAELSAGWVHPFLTPEHLIAPGTIGPRTDVYSLAAIAYYLYTGRPPFSSSGDVRAAILRGQLDLPVTVSRNLAGGLEAPLRKAMSRDPGERFPDCMGFMTALEAGVDPAARLPEPGQPAGSSQKLIYAGIASVVLAILVALLLLLHGPKKPGGGSASTGPAAHSGPIAASGPALSVADAKLTRKAKSTTPRQTARDVPQVASRESRPGPFPPGSSPRSGPDAAPRQAPPAPKPPSPAPTTQPPVSAATFIPPSSAPRGYSLEIYSQLIDDKHLITRGLSFRYHDRVLGNMSVGELKARIILSGIPPPAKGHRLSIEWDIDGKIWDGRLVSPNTVVEFNSEPIRGSYQVILRLDTEQVADYTFRIEP